MEKWEELEKWANKEAKHFTIKTLQQQGYDTDYIVKTLQITIEEYLELTKDLE